MPEPHGRSSPSERDVRDKIDQLKRLGMIEVHPEDKDKPWSEQRLRRTALGETLALTVEAMQEENQS